MSPDELRAAAESVLSSLAEIVTEVGGDPSSLDTPAARCAHATLRLADVITYADPMSKITMQGLAATYPMHPHLVEVMRLAQTDPSELVSHG